MRGSRHSDRTPGRRCLPAVCAVMITGGSLLGCDLAVAPDPSLINEVDLQGESSLNARVTGLRANLKQMANGVVDQGGLFGDELWFGGSLIVGEEIDRRAVGLLNTQVNGSLYAPLQRAAAMSKALQRDILAERFPTVIPDPANSEQMALASMVGGYARLFLGELFCTTAFDGKGPEYASSEVYRLAMEEFALAIAATGASAEDRNAALVGRARAQLHLGQLDGAVADAEAVTEGFEYVVEFSGTPGDDNAIWSSMFAGNLVSTIGDRFRGLTIDGSNIMDPRTDVFDQDKPTYGGQSQAFAARKADDRGDPIRWASWEEAQLIIAEARPERTVEIINMLRTVRGLPSWNAANATPMEVAAKLRDERARALFLEGRRVGDLRRYAELYGVELWEDHPLYQAGQRGNQTCIPMLDWERRYNPDL